MLTKHYFQGCLLYSVIIDWLCAMCQVLSWNPRSRDSHFRGVERENVLCGTPLLADSHRYSPAKEEGRELKSPNACGLSVCTGIVVGVASEYAVAVNVKEATVEAFKVTLKEE